MRIHQDLRESDQAVSYYSVRRFVRRLGVADSSSLPYRRMECVPGAECQVDFGTGAPIVTAEGRPRNRNRKRPHVFRIVLSHSRKFSTQDVHITNTKISGVEQGAVKLLDRVRLIGPQAGRWSEAMLQCRGIEGVRVLMGLLSLSNRHSFAAVDRACGIAASHGAYRLRSIRQLIARETPAQEELTLPGFMDEHPIIRSLGDYGELVKAAFQTSDSSSL